MPAYEYQRFPLRPCAEAAGSSVRHKVGIVGGGPVGLTAALELAAYGIPSVVFKDGATVSEGSRALCWSERTLQILERHGVAEPIVRKGYTWSAGRVFHGGEELYRFELQDRGHHKYPAFVNLQQYFAEEYLVEAVAKRPEIDLRWQSKVIGVEPCADGTILEVETSEGVYRTLCDWVIAADGARSTVRRCLGLEFAGQVFEDNFLIADVDVEAALPSADRRFWFHPDFFQGETALCHKQGDNMWRVDFQLGWNIDREAEKSPERVIARVKSMLGDHAVSLTWVSIYTFQARRLERFRHGNLFFAGDAAHQVSPFGARGGNSGVQDAENLAWKLAWVIQGKATESLLDSYDAERGLAADENIRVTSRTTRFMTPKDPIARVFQNAVLGLAADFPFARALVNSGRLSTPTVHHGSPLSSEYEGFGGGIPPGAPCPNPPFGNGYLLDHVRWKFQGLYFGETLPADCAVETLLIGPEHAEVWRTFDAQAGNFYLLRPDQHVAARLSGYDATKVRAALDRALGSGT